MWNSTALDRSIISISGEDSAAFLQGLITNDITKVTADRSIYSALLTPQGKFLYDFFIMHTQDGFLIDVASSWAQTLKDKLSKFKLRSKISLELLDTHTVSVVWGHGEPISNLINAGDTITQNNSILFVDPRHPGMGLRCISTESALPIHATESTQEEYHFHRLSLGIPDGERDMLPEKDILLELHFEELNGVDFQKGCYMGQELTARTKYRALIKKHLYTVTAAEGTPLPEPSTAVMVGDKQIGELRGSTRNLGLAMLRDEDVAPGSALKTRDITLTAKWPAWVGNSQQDTE